MVKRKELDAFFKKKSELLRDKETVKGLQQYADNDVSGELKDAIRTLEDTIEQKERELAGEERVIKDSISTVEDLTIRSILLLRYVEAQPWKIIGAVFGLSDKMVTERVYNYFRKADNEVCQRDAD